MGRPRSDLFHHHTRRGMIHTDTGQENPNGGARSAGLFSPWWHTPRRTRQPARRKWPAQ